MPAAWGVYFLFNCHKHPIVSLTLVCLYDATSGRMVQILFKGQICLLHDGAPSGETRRKGLSDQIQEPCKRRNCATTTTLCHPKKRKKRAKKRKKIKTRPHPCKLTSKHEPSIPWVTLPTITTTTASHTNGECGWICWHTCSLRTLMAMAAAGKLQAFRSCCSLL